MPHDACIDHRAAFSFCFTLSRILMVNDHHFVTMYYFHPFRLAKSSIAAQNLSHGANVICNGSPSRIRIVRRISLGMTTRPRSSMRRTIPVAFILSNLSCPSLGTERILFVPVPPGRRSRRRPSAVYGFIIRDRR